MVPPKVCVEVLTLVPRKVTQRILITTPTCVWWGEDGVVPHQQAILVSYDLPQPGVIQPNSV